MKEGPILFSAPMVRALLNGTKTQTRRVIKGNPGRVYWNPIVLRGYGGWVDDHGRPKPCRYGLPGDRLWVREAFTGDFVRFPTADGPKDLWWHQVPRAFRLPQNMDYLWYQADGGIYHAPVNGGQAGLPHMESTWQPTPADRAGLRWQPSIHMPRWVSRLTLEVTDLRAQRVQDISEEDAIAEGCPAGSTSYQADYVDVNRMMNRIGRGAAVSRFALLWDSINAKRGNGWDRNDWVWCVTFTQYNAPNE